MNSCPIPCNVLSNSEKMNADFNHELTSYSENDDVNFICTRHINYHFRFMYFFLNSNLFNKLLHQKYFKIKAKK